MNGWKITAIIFIILFVLETISVAWMITIGLQQNDKEKECSISVCGNGGYVSYIYEADVCHCYNSDGKQMLVKYLN